MMLMRTRSVSPTASGGAGCCDTSAEMGEPTTWPTQVSGTQRQRRHTHQSRRRRCWSPQTASPAVSAYRAGAESPGSLHRGSAKAVQRRAWSGGGSVGSSRGGGGGGGSNAPDPSALLTTGIDAMRSSCLAGPFCPGLAAGLAAAEEGEGAEAGASSLAAMATTGRLPRVARPAPALRGAWPRSAGRRCPRAWGRPLIRCDRMITAQSGSDRPPPSSRPTLC